MNKIRIYNDEEIKILISNPNVDGIKNKSQIIYNNNFKLWAIKQKLIYPEKTAREIFISGGFDMNILDDSTPRKRLLSWINKYKLFGEDYFTNKNKYSYISKLKESDTNNREEKFVCYIKKKISNQKFVAFIIDKDENKKIRITNLVSIDDEKINN